MNYKSRFIKLPWNDYIKEFTDKHFKVPIVTILMDLKEKNVLINKWLEVALQQNRNYM